MGSESRVFDDHWRPVAEAPGYWVSYSGDVKSPFGRILRHKIHKRDKHHSVCLIVGGRRYWRQVHRLVLTAFVGPCPDGLEGCHDDGMPGNNHVRNLRWDTRGNNHLDQVRHGTHHESKKTRCPQGHRYDAANTYRYGRKRQCGKCRARRNAESNAARKARRQNRVPRQHSS